MFVNKGWEFVPRFAQMMYIPEGIVLRNSLVAKWYAYLKWRIKFFDTNEVGMLQSVEYVFPNMRIPFNFRGKEFEFVPDFEIKYIGDYRTEYHTLVPVNGNNGSMIRKIESENPLIKVVVVEPLEVKKIIIFMRKAGLSLGYTCCYANTFDKWNSLLEERRKKGITDM